MSSERRIERYLYAGEEIQEAFDVGPTRVVFTSHRVFVLDPDEDGFQHAEFPNITGVERAVRGSKAGIVWGVALSVIATVFAVLAVVVRTSGAFETPEFDEATADAIGAGPLSTLVEWTFFLLENFETMLVGSAVALFALALVPVGYYWVRVREKTLAIRLAGEQSDIHLPLAYIPAEDEQALRERLTPGQKAAFDRAAESESEGTSELERSAEQSEMSELENPTEQDDTETTANDPAFESERADAATTPSPESSESGRDRQR